MNTLTYGSTGEAIQIPSGTDLAELKAAITTQLKAGGGWVDVPTLHGMRRPIFVSPGVAISLGAIRNDG